MITKYLWEDVNFSLLSNILLGVFFSIITIPIDLMISPLEIISFIIYKAVNK